MTSMMTLLQQTSLQQPFLQHLLDLVLFLVIVLGPVPFCLWVVAVTTQKNTLRLAHYGLVILTVWCSLQTAIALSLGAIHGLRLHFISITEIIIFQIGFLLFSASRNRFSSFYDQRIVHRFEQQEIVIGVAFAFVFLNLLVQTIVIPITNYDSLAYHLPVMAQWYQVGHFTILDQFKSDLIGYYPYSWEALCLLFMFPFREDILSTLPNLLAWLILGAATYLISQLFSAQRIHCLAASFLVLTVPILTQAINTIHVDLPFAAFFMAALYFLFLWWSSRLISDFVLFLLSSGMMLGIKTSSIPYAALLILVILLCPVVFPNRSTMWVSGANQRSQGFATMGGAIAVLLGSFWYIRNLLLTGNPFGLLRVKIAGFELFPGPIETSSFKTTSLAHVFRWLNVSDWIVVIKQIGLQYGLPFGLIVLQLLVFVAMVAFRRISLQRSTLLSLGLFGILIVSMAVLYFNTPYTGSNANPPKLTNWMGQGLRYALAGVALLGVVSAIGSSLIRLRKELVTAACVLSSVVFWVNCWIL